MDTKSSKKQKDFWEHPWSYMESFTISFGLLLTGFIIEVFLPTKREVLISYPYNVFLLVGYIALLLTVYLRYTDIQLIRWLTKVPASIASIVFVLVMVMVMGIVPQIPSNNAIVNIFGLNHVTTHWAFLLILLQFLTCLGLVTIKRILQFNSSNFGFVVSHLGLFIAILCGVLGSGDLKKLSLDAYENQPVFEAYDADKRKIVLPFAIYLNDFIIEEYNPKLALVDNKTGQIVHNNGKNLYLVEAGEKYYFLDYEVAIETFYESAGKVGNKYFPVNEVGAPPAAKLTVYNKTTKDTVKGWMSSGSFRFPYEGLKISEAYSMVMTVPEPKEFSSEITILEKSGKEIQATLEVNKAFNYQGWNIYQTSYDEKMGKWSDLSVVELVKDPWLPFVYFGIFMMLIGALHMFWMGNNIKKTT